MQNFENSAFTLKEKTLPSKSRSNLKQVLELLLNTSDIHVLTQLFSTLGLYLLSSETNYESIIKCDQLYDKIVIVLNSGLQEKTTIAINLICALLYRNDSGQTRKKSLHIYAQNMIRISGCLTSMTNIFISLMMHQDTLKAVCRGISEACRECTNNQTYCSHIVSLCIRRCRGGISDMFIVLQSLLTNHSRNIKLFHDHNGMRIFTRESLQHPYCLQLLNTVVENTTNENRHVILSESGQLFDHLRYFLQTYGASNSLGQWVSIILFSYQKVLSKYEGESNISVGIGNIRKCKEKYIHSLRQVVCNDNRNDTNELYRNILKEVIGVQNINYDRIKNIKRRNNSAIRSFKNIQHITALGATSVERELMRENTGCNINSVVLEEPVSTANKDLSFSFLLKAHPKQSLENDRNREIGVSSYIPSPNSKEYVDNDSLVLSCNKQTVYNYSRDIPNEDNDSIFHFAPPFVSTPKSKTRTLKTDSRSQSSRLPIMRSASTRQYHRKYGMNKTKNIKKMSDSKIQNKTIGAKFIDIVNGSCTTLVKSFTSFKNIFRHKEPSTCKDVSTSTSCTDKFKLPLSSNSFTNYMRKRDAMSNCCDRENNESYFKREFDDENNNFSSCNTCNDTIALKQKLTNDATLQQTVKRLKFGINLYGCNFKKISRTMWPNEQYMTPSVLYNLYRKLIIK